MSVNPIQEKTENSEDGTQYSVSSSEYKRNVRKVIFIYINIYKYNFLYIVTTSTVLTEY